MCKLFGASFDFYNFVTSAMFRVRILLPVSVAISSSSSRTQFRLEDVVEEINEVHVSAWAEMLQKSRNSELCINTSLTAYMDVYSLQKHTIAFSNAKIKRVVGYNLTRPFMTQDVLREVVDKWKEEGSWPIFE